MSAGFAPCSEFLRAMIARGHVHQCTDMERLDEVARGGVTAYIGYDLTAPSLHVGNLATIMMLRRLQQGGGRPIVLMGGGTTRVGDPSGKDETRKILSPETISANRESQKAAFAKFLDFGDGPAGAVMADNADWLLPLNYIDFLRDVGPHFTINRMLTMDSVKLRLEREQPLTFIEFNYMILQAFDFVELYKRHGCRLQMGGSDQWGNIVNGVDLGRRMRDADLFGLTTPLLTTTSGAKMGKTVDGAVWLNPDLRSPYEYWQFWRNTEDADVARFLRLFTDLPLDEIARLEKLQGAEINDAKKVLATEATALLHGKAAAVEAENAARATFEQGGAAAGLPSIEVNADELANGLRLTAALTRAGLTASNGEAKRLIEQGAIAVNNATVSISAQTLSERDVAEGVIKLSRGKTKHALIRIV
ncbi:MAG TPA: tyrosine--tRNA ligase [Caulobacterales bacterium]|nr:tyrosine--tRNA ligase [Caulobacterales bacterium]